MTVKFKNITIVDKGIQILKEKIRYFFFFNSSESRIKVMNSARRKVILSIDLIREFNPFEENCKRIRRISKFVVFEGHGLVVFSYYNHNMLYVYSYLKRTLVQEIEVFSNRVRERGIQKC